IMKASAVINSYKNGNRDFSGQKLRGKNFAGQNLSGANFSNCDIRGANFKGATLIGANFTGATAGLQKPWMIGLLLVAFLFIGLSSFFSAIAGGLVVYIFDISSVENQVIGWTSLLIFLILSIVSYFRGLGRGLGAVALALPFVLAGALVLALVGVLSGGGAGVVTVAAALVGA
ncbi:pentapeptide repeat-containing protein, partial [Crocosphaera watsonii]